MAQPFPCVGQLGSHGGAVRSKVACSARLFSKWDASADPEYAPDPHGEAVNPQQIVAQARQMIEQYGFESIKLKAGVFDPGEEADAVLALVAAFPTHPLRIDPNRNWTMATSLRVADKLAGYLEYCEGPTPHWKAWPIFIVPRPCHWLPPWWSPIGMSSSAASN